MLAELLRRLYSTRRLRAVIQSLPNGQDILDQLPQGLSRVDFAAQAVESLHRRGHVDEQFFSVLVEHSPESFADLAEVASHWEVKISDRPWDRLLVGSRPTRRESGREARSRTEALRRMRAYWLGDLLETGLQALPLVKLNIHERPNLVSLSRGQGCPAMAAAQEPHQAVLEAYHLAQGNILLLGEPGSGKTTALLAIARALFDEAQANELCSIPIILNLASWRARDSTIESWISKELMANHCIPCLLSQRWIAADDIVLLLDGLDEVPVTERVACVHAINRFRRSFMIPTLVCSRTKPYVAAGVRLALERAIELQPLSEGDVERCLGAAGAEGAALRELAAADPAIEAFTRSPLMLSIMLPIAGRLELASIRCASLEMSRRRVFSVYYETMIERRKRTIYTPKDLRRWTRYLARAMLRSGISECRVERIQPSWLPSRVARMVFAAVSISALSLAAMGTSSIVDALHAARRTESGEVAALERAASDESAWNSEGMGEESACFASDGADDTQFAGPPRRPSLASDRPPGDTDEIPGAPWQLGGDLLSESILAVLRVMVGVPLLFLQWIRGRLMRIDIYDGVAWSWRAWLWLFMRIALAIALVAAMLVTALADDVPWIACESALKTVSVVVGVSLVVGVLFSPIGGIIPSTRIGEGGRLAWCRRTGFQALLAALVSLLPFLALEAAVRFYLGITAWLALYFGSWVAVYVFYLRGGDTIVQHFTLRFILGLQRALPWRMYRFLDYCVELGLLRRAGNSYMFVHFSLQEALAAEEPAASPEVKQ